MKIFNIARNGISCKHPLILLMVTSHKKTEWLLFNAVKVTNINPTFAGFISHTATKNGKEIFFQEVPQSQKHPLAKSTKISNFDLSFYFPGNLCLKNFLLAATSTDKIFEKNSSFLVKQRTTEKVQFLFSRSLLLVLTKFPFSEEDWALGYTSMKF